MQLQHAKRLLADENFNNAILRGLQQADSEIDVVRVQDNAMKSAPDPELLSWAVEAHRILLPHDVNTMLDYVYARLENGLSPACVIAVSEVTPVGKAVEDILLVIQTMQPGDFDNPVRFIPLR